MPDAKLTGQSGAYTRDASAVAADILSGKTGYVNDVKLTGTIPSLAAVSYTPGVADQIISAGQYLSGDQTIIGDANLLAPYIKHDVTLFGVTGNYIGTVAIVTETIEGGVWCPACGTIWTSTFTFSGPIYSLVYTSGQLFSGSGVAIHSGPVISGNQISWTFDNNFYNSGATLEYKIRCNIIAVTYS